MEEDNQKGDVIRSSNHTSLTINSEEDGGPKVVHFMRSGFKSATGKGSRWLVYEETPHAFLGGEVDEIGVILKLMEPTEILKVYGVKFTL